MGDTTSLVLNQPSPSEAERRRIRDLSRYYCTVQHPSDVQPQQASSQNGEPSLSSDITLNALAQLAVYRFGCDRAFVSLIDGESQHIIAEVTKSISLRDGSKHHPDDGIYLGVTTMDLGFGVCPDAVRLFTGQSVPALKTSENMTADVSRFIVRDFTKEVHFRDRPYVQQWPYFRFYAEVPVYSPSGHVLGSFCVVDNKPRQEFSDDDATALQEISDSISQHLENVRTVHYHRRSDRLVHGLTDFAKRRFHHQVSTGETNKHSNPVNGQQLLKDTGSCIKSTVSTSASVTSGERSSSPSSTQSSDLTAETADSTQESHRFAPSGSKDEIVSKETQYTTTTADAKGNNQQETSDIPFVTVKESITTSKRVSGVFSSASSLIRESMDLDGVLFVDAGSSNPGFTIPNNAEVSEPICNTSERRFSHGSFSHSTSPFFLDKPCEFLGLAVEDFQAVRQCQVPEHLVQQLVRSFPNGEVFHLRDVIDQSETETCDHGPGKNQMGEIEHQLRNGFPNADSVIFLPLWDWDKAQWLAGTFLWTKDRERALGLEELDYFKIFSDSITSEVARINWSKQEQSKSRFISSISHELRSPLHGILASSELLSGTTLSTNQQDIVNMLQTCGQTLLDTMNHLLDFTKINNLTTSKGAGRAFKQDSAASLVSCFDLGRLVEDVVKTMHLGQVHPAKAQTLDSHGGRFETSENNNSIKSRPSVVVNLDPRTNWRVRSVSGAWRRIIMNLVGNALKYTESGFVEISLSLHHNQSESGHPVFKFSVTDSGRGMSPEYLRHKVFSPFSQENHLSEGVGLGLCIVHQLVTSLNGSIDLKSQPGAGTQINILVPMESQETADPSSLRDIQTNHTRFCIVGLNKGSGFTEKSSSTEAKRRRIIQSFFTSLVNTRPGWTISFADTLEDALGDVVIAEESFLQGRDLQGLNNPKLSQSKSSRFILLPDTISPENCMITPGEARIARLAQPLCPQSALDALQKMSKPVKRLKPLTHNLKPNPTVEAKNQSRTTIPTPPREVALHQKGLHVLIVDDNPINVKVLSMYMHKLGWTSETASNGLIALDAYKKSPSVFKLVLMDISMPVMDGVEATRNMRLFEQEQSLWPINIIAITGVGSTVTRQQAVSAGVNNYMIKPLSIKQLELAIRDI